MDGRAEAVALEFVNRLAGRGVEDRDWPAHGSSGESRTIGRPRQADGVVREGHLPHRPQLVLRLAENVETGHGECPTGIGEFEAAITQGTSEIPRSAPAGSGCDR